MDERFPQLWYAFPFRETTPQDICIQISNRIQVLPPSSDWSGICKTSGPAQQAAARGPSQVGISGRPTVVTDVLSRRGQIDDVGGDRGRVGSGQGAVLGQHFGANSGPLGARIMLVFGGHNASPDFGPLFRNASNDLLISMNFGEALCSYSGGIMLLEFVSIMQHNALAKVRSIMRHNALGRRHASISSLQVL